MSVFVCSLFVVRFIFWGVCFFFLVLCILFVCVFFVLCCVFSGFFCFLFSGGRRSSRGHSRAARRGAPGLVPGRDRPPQAAEGHGRAHSVATKGLTTRWGIEETKKKGDAMEGTRDRGNTQKRIYIGKKPDSSEMIVSGGL